MTPRTDIAALPDSATVREAAALFLRHGHARVPVYHESIDNVVGVLHVHEVLAAMSGGYESNPVTGYLRPAFFVPETQSVAELLAQMRTKTHIALVVDEYGALVGLATLEDLLEEIVGEIRDEHESAEARLVQEQDGSWVVSGKAHVEEIEDLFELVGYARAKHIALVEGPAPHETVLPPPALPTTVVRLGSTPLASNPLSLPVGTTGCVPMPRAWHRGRWSRSRPVR